MSLDLQQERLRGHGVLDALPAETLTLDEGMVIEYTGESYPKKGTQGPANCYSHWVPVGRLAIGRRRFQFVARCRFLYAILTARLALRAGVVPVGIGIVRWIVGHVGIEI